MSLVASEMKDVTTQQVVLILGLSALVAGVIIWLAILGLDPGQVLAGLSPFALLLGGLFGWAKVNDLKRDVGDVKEMSNGRLTQLQDDNKELHAKVASLSMYLQPPDQDGK